MCFTICRDPSRASLSAYLGDEFLLHGGGEALVERLGAPREGAHHAVDVDRGVGDALQQELLVDDVLAWKK